MSAMNTNEMNTAVAEVVLTAKQIKAKADYAKRKAKKQQELAIVEKEIRYYVLSNSNLEQVETAPSLDEYEIDCENEIDGATEITYKKIGTDEVGNDVDEESEVEESEEEEETDNYRFNDCEDCGDEFDNEGNPSLKYCENCDDHHPHIPTLVEIAETLAVAVVEEKVKKTTDSEDEDEVAMTTIQKRVAERQAKRDQEETEKNYLQWRQDNAERVLSEWVEDQISRINKCCEKDQKICLAVIHSGIGEDNHTILTQVANCVGDDFLSDVVKTAYENTIAKKVVATKVGGGMNRAVRKGKIPEKKPVGEQKAFLGEKKVLGERENRKIFKDGELLKHQIRGCIKLKGGADAYNGNNVWTCRYRKDEDLFRCKVEGGGLLTERVENMVKKLKKTFEGEWVIGRELEGVVFQFESLNQFAAVHNAIWRPNDPSSCESIWKGGNVRLVRKDGDNEMMDIKNLPLLKDE